MLVSRQAVDEFLDRRLESYLWMKGLTREDIERELKQLKVQPVFKTRPWLHQLVSFYIGICQPYFLFLLDMGLGKSKILADLITQAVREKSVQRALITVPRVINMSSWARDLAVHSELEPWLIDVADSEEKWERLSQPKGEVTVIDYQGLHWAVCDKVKIKGKKAKTALVRNDKKMAHLRKLYQFIGIDESHYLKSHDNLWFGIMQQLVKDARHVHATTGTLFNKDPTDMWSQFYLVDGGETFGANLGMFRGAFFTAEADDWAGTKFVYNKRRSVDLNRMLQHRSIRYDQDEVPEVDLPKRTHIMEELDFDPEQREHYLRALQGLINAQGQGEDKLKAPWIRMRMILSGYLAWNDDEGSHLIHFKRNPKMEEMERLLEEMGDSKIVVVHYYVETGRLITEHLNKLKIKHTWLYGGTKNKAATVETFMGDPTCRVFVMNSASGGVGNDGLQKVAQYMYMFETPTGPTEREQCVKRIHRPGQRERVFIYDPVIRRSIDKGILEDIAAGRDLYTSVLNGQRLRRDILRG